MKISKRISYEQARFLASLIDNQVCCINKQSGCYVIKFVDGKEATVAAEYQLALLLLAALAHENLRGIRSGLGEVLSCIEAVDDPSIYIQLRNDYSILLSIRSSVDYKVFLLHRLHKQIAPPYSMAEFWNINGQKITEKAPGRALAPLPSSDFRTRARQIIERLLADDQEGLLSLPPMIVVLGITDYCNHKCPFCFRERDPLYERSNGDVFTDSNLTSLFLNLAEAGVHSLRLCGEGEDTIHPQYLKYILLARVSGMNLMQITNGTMLDKLAPVMVRCIDFLRVSVNGWTEEQYRKKHGLIASDGFGRVLAGLRLASVERKALTSSRFPTVCISTVLTEEDSSEYRPEDFRDLFSITGADIAILKNDRECSRTVSEGLVRLKIHQDTGINSYAKVQSEKLRSAPSSDGSVKENQDAFLRLLKKCRESYPRAFSGTAQSSLRDAEQPKDWITKLKLGCVLRYVRVELERLEMFNCSQLHDYYGDLRTTSARAAWVSKARIEGINKDIKRSSILCPTCGWGDLFNLMNYFIDDELRNQTLLERLN